MADGPLIVPLKEIFVGQPPPVGEGGRQLQLPFQAPEASAGIEAAGEGAAGLLDPGDSHASIIEKSRQVGKLDHHWKKRYILCSSGCSLAAKAPALGAGDRRFKSS